MEQAMLIAFAVFLLVLIFFGSGYGVFCHTAGGEEKVWRLIWRM